MAIEEAQWMRSFIVDGVKGGPIRLEQLNRKQFALKSNIRYTKDTGLEKKFKPGQIDLIRDVGPEHVGATDLVSVPKPMRWFAGRYGDHTPAALVHDRFIGIKEEDKPIKAMTDQDADRYFRFMLHRTGVPWLRRWIMWAAVAFRTRFAAGDSKRWSVIIWTAAVLATTTGFGYAVAQGRWGLMVVALLAPIPLSALWRRQWGAGLVAAYSAPLLLPPTIVALVADGLYWVLENVARIFQTKAVSGDAPIRPESFPMS